MIGKRTFEALTKYIELFKASLHRDKRSLMTALFGIHIAVGLEQEGSYSLRSLFHGVDCAYKIAALADEMKGDMKIILIDEFTARALYPQLLSSKRNLPFHRLRKLYRNK